CWALSRLETVTAPLSEANTLAPAASLVKKLTNDAAVGTFEQLAAMDRPEVISTLPMPFGPYGWVAIISVPPPCASISGCAVPIQLPGVLALIDLPCRMND